MGDVRLLERLTHQEDPGAQAGVPPDRLLRDSVADHLARLLNTRAGSAPIDPEYGMPDMSNIAGSFALGTLESLSESLLRQVRRYEQRLLDPRITIEREQRDVISLRFELVGRLAGGDGAPRQPCSFVLRVNSSGRVFVQAKS